MTDTPSSLPLVLLGAGASAPAGVPTTSEMTLAMMKHCETDGQREYGRALAAISGALQMGVGQHTAPGSDVPDVERVLNAATLLGDRLSLEFAPFVAAWHPIIEELERHQLSAFEVRDIAERAGASFDTVDLMRGPDRASDIRDAVQRAFDTAFRLLATHLSRRPDGALFRDLASYLKGRLIRLTLRKDPEQLAYLDPLLKARRSGMLTVATLNYDNTIELRSHAMGIPCETGLREWSTTGVLSQPDKGIDLIKLHGSVKWLWSGPIIPHAGLGVRELMEVSDKEIDDTGSHRFGPEAVGRQLGVIFGGTNKLTAEGPFLDLLAKFDRLLNERPNLFVIGYSFRDPHVNHCIARWLDRDTSRKITVVDRPATQKGDHPLYRVYGHRLEGRFTFEPSGAEEGIANHFG